MTQPCNYSVLVVDDHQMTRLGLKALSQASGRLRLEWLEAGNLGDALNIFSQRPDIALVLLDLNLPDSKGLQGLRRFIAEYPRAQVAVFSGTEDEFVVRQAFALGAVGFVPKSASGDATLRLVESLLGCPSTASDKRPSPEGLPDTPSRGPGPSHAAPARTLAPDLRARTATLNATQLKVLELVLAGMSNQEIAIECGLALGTVKNTVSSVMLALDVHSRSHLISVF